MLSTTASKAVATIANARLAWDADCGQVEVELSNIGLGFGVNGYRISMERCARRLEEATAFALTSIAGSATLGTHDRRETYAVLHEAIDVEFTRPSRLLPALHDDPLLAQLLDQAHQRIRAHGLAQKATWWRWPFRWLGTVWGWWR